MYNTSRPLFTLISAALALALTGCGAASAPSATSTRDQASATATTERAAITEASAPSVRIALTYDGGIMIVDGKTFEAIETIEKEGFLRLQPAGDNRHLVVADGSSYTMLDMGAWTQAHGDHDHYYTTTPTLTSLSFAADGTGHVITDYGRSAMFADNTGTIEVYSPADLTGDDQYTATNISTETITLPDAHHGLAIPLENNQYLVSVGTEDARTGAAVINADGSVVTESLDCPGIHGEAIAANDTFTVGCQDGALIYADGTFTKITNPEDLYSRSGNQAGSADSAIVLADYKTDQDAELERPEQFALIHTITKERTKIALPEGISYTFRSLARGPEGSHLLLTTDGKLRFWAEDGTELGSVDIMDSWTESEIWQDPRPAIWVDGETAYVTDPATKKLHVVSLAKIADGTAEVFASIDLPEVPNEINGISRTAELVTTTEVDSDH
ncbi:hypothetical protein E4U03_01195 [Rothia nasimurium]|uniref:ABC transporter n=1 Tax=Rothia nasimurium TaxID=85336 RepID=A0A4Y9F623_9MICC|nr:hypothetical protein [Rothia nasimurium]MBF0807235.1 hypothetical protein [Rothia nasimurium]TFU23980.1 hypothetical protein E4U03_01195 [Rothia nasimurium]